MIVMITMMMGCLNMKSAEAKESNVQSCFPNLEKGDDDEYDNDDFDIIFKRWWWG